MRSHQTVVLGVTVALVACLIAARPDARAGARAANPCEPRPICRINHIMVIVQENMLGSSDLANEFDFRQAPRPAPILNEPPLLGPAESPYPRTRQVGFGDG